MKIAVPVAQGKLAMHFGHCEEFALIEVEGKEIKGTTSVRPPAHSPGVLPKFLHEQGASCIIAGGMGQRAQSLFSQNGIEVIIGAGSLEPTELVKAYLDGNLETGANICDH